MADTENKRNSFNGRKNKSDEVLKRFADMMVEIIKKASGNNWKKGWMGANSSIQGLPQNISGRPYSGGNAFFLMFHTAEKGYKSPVYMTFHQAREQQLHVNKGEHSIPIFKWGLSIKDENGKKISEDTYNLMSQEERAKMDVRPFPRVFNVFNIDQTNLEEVNKKKYDAIVARFQAPPQEVKDTEGMYANEALDRMFEKRGWYTDIQYDKPANSAVYRPLKDIIVLPMKHQFKMGQTPDEVYRDGMEYYSTALHEMAHSTGHPSRLNRQFGAQGTDKYAHEELIAEMTSALVGSTMGFDKKILENNANYLSGWLRRLREKPETITAIMTDVGKASDMIIEKIDEQRVALNQSPLKAGNLQGLDEELSETTTRGKTLHDLQAQYSRINGQYPASVDDERTRQIAKRIRQAEQVITAYNANVAAAYGDDFAFSESASATLIPHAVYSGREPVVLENQGRNNESAGLDLHGSENIEPQDNENASSTEKENTIMLDFREIPVWDAYEREKGMGGDYTFQETAEDYGKTLLAGVEDILPKVRAALYRNQWGEDMMSVEIVGDGRVYQSRHIPEPLGAWLGVVPSKESHSNMESTFRGRNVDIAAAHMFSAAVPLKEDQFLNMEFSNGKQSWIGLDAINKAKKEGQMTDAVHEAFRALESARGVAPKYQTETAAAFLKHVIKEQEYYGTGGFSDPKGALSLLESGEVTAKYVVTKMKDIPEPTYATENRIDQDRNPINSADDFDEFHEALAEWLDNMGKDTENVSLSEDDNPRTDLAHVAEKIMEENHVSKGEAEKMAAPIVESQQAAVNERKQKAEQAKQEAVKRSDEARKAEDERRREAEEQRRREEESRKGNKDGSQAAKLLLHATLLLGALELAKGNKGVWMNKAGKSNAEFLGTQRPITAYNNIMMNLQSDQKGYRSNVYTFYESARENGMPIRHDESSLGFNWTKWDYQNVGTKDIISREDYDKLPTEEKDAYVKHSTRETISVFNVDQTTMPTAKHADYSALLKDKGAKHEELSDRGVNGMVGFSEKLKSKHPTAIIIARTDNQYRVYGNDASKAGKILGLPVGNVDVDGKKVKTVGFPIDRLTDHLTKLVQAKQWVAVAENLDSAELIRGVADGKDILNKAYSTAQAVAKNAGVGYERVMVLQSAEYDRQADKITVSGMSDSDRGNSRQAAIEKANDIYRAVVAATGSEQRLDRMGRNNLLPNDDAKYERLVQDLSAGVLMARQGLPATLSRESMQNIDYWKREIRENPKLLGLLEKDVNNAVESIDKHLHQQLVKYEEIRKGLPPKDLVSSHRQYQVSSDLAKIPNIESKEIVIVRDKARESADVILPEGASLEDNVEISGIRKDRIRIALGREGITDVKFHNAGGALGLNETNDYYKGKIVSIDRLKQYEFSQHREIDVEPLVAASALPKIEIFTHIRDEKGQYAFFFKPENEPSFSVYPNEAHKRAYFDVRGTDKEKEVHDALAQKYYSVARQHPEIKVDLIMPKVPDVDTSRLVRPTITKDRYDPSKKWVMATIDGKFMKQEISKAQWDRMWLADDMSAYKKAVATIAFAPQLREGTQREKSVSMETREQAPARAEQPGDVQSAEKPAEKVSEAVDDKKQEAHRRESSFRR